MRIHIFSSLIHIKKNKYSRIYFMSRRNNFHDIRKWDESENEHFSWSQHVVHYCFCFRSVLFYVSNSFILCFHFLFSLYVASDGIRKRTDRSQRVYTMNIVMCTHLDKTKKMERKNVEDRAVNPRDLKCEINLHDVAHSYCVADKKKTTR